MCSATRRSCGASATNALIASTARQPTSAEAPSGGSAFVSVAGERAAHESTSRPVASVQSSACRPATDVLALLQVLAEADERRDCRERDRTEQRVEGETVRTAGVGERRDDDEQSR